MFEGWGEYYLLVGTAAATFIGLLFVVITLTSRIERSRVLQGSRLYMTPIVMHFAFVLVISGLALAPDIAPRAIGWVVGVAAVLGAIRSAFIAFGVRSVADDETGGWDDVFWYGIAPAVTDLALAGASAAVCLGLDWAPDGFAAVTMVLLLVCIHNAWDLVTWLAPRPDGEAAKED